MTAWLSRRQTEPRWLQAALTPRERTSCTSPPYRRRVAAREDCVVCVARLQALCGHAHRMELIAGRCVFVPIMRPLPPSSVLLLMAVLSTVTAVGEAAFAQSGDPRGGPAP